MESENTTKNSFANINATTALKGLAILIIMIHHVGVNGYYCGYFHPLGGIGVAMFLFLSGYGITESYKKNKLTNFWKKKITRLFIPYIIWIPLYYITMYYSILGSPKYFNIIPRYWFIEYLFIMYLIFYFIFPLRRVWAISIITTICTFLFFFFNNLQAEQSLSFWAGVWFSIYKTKISEVSINKKMLIASFFLIIGLTSLIIKQELELSNFDYEGIYIKTANLLIKLPIGLSIIIVFLAIEKYYYKWLIFIGGLTYELYLTHIPFFMLIDKRTEYLIIFVIQTALLAYFLHITSNKISKAIEKHGKFYHHR